MKLFLSLFEGHWVPCGLLLNGWFLVYNFAVKAKRKRISVKMILMMVTMITAPLIDWME